jgi:hypothetical protein
LSFSALWKNSREEWQKPLGQEWLKVAYLCFQNPYLTS